MPVLVLDPYSSASWNANFVTENPSFFLNTVKRSTKCALFVDECGALSDDGHDEILKWLATNSRHLGHNCHFITQRAMQVSPTVRDQCRNLFMFRQSLADCQIMARDKADDFILEACKLKPGEYIAKIGISEKSYKARVF